MTRIAAVQFEADADAEPTANLARAMRIVRAQAADADVVCLPEYFATPYFPKEVNSDAFDLAVPDDGEFVDTIRKTAAETGTAIIAPIFEEGSPGGRYYNSAVVVESQGISGKYRKLHPFHRPGYNESYYFATGDLGAPVIDTADLRFGIMLCFDRHFPELARVYALRGADAVFIPTCSYGELNRDSVWRKELVGLAVATSMYVVGVNRAGSEGDKSHFGASTVIDPTGTAVASLDSSPGTLFADLDHDLVTDVRRTTKHLNVVHQDLLPDRDRL